MATALKAIAGGKRGSDKQKAEHRCSFYVAASDAGAGLVRIGTLLEALREQNCDSSARASLLRDALIDKAHAEVVSLLDSVLDKADFEWEDFVG